ncbi:HDOD domain-containing protein [Anaerospora sp.]|uniref:EAL and HDOD domain-containing protein n=1 Tax=Anaerospora sp. TaxID=1960278 RepID=UPI0028995020|nr:HDOD domain-containing protein [Anaerospora sp.]
MQVFVARQPIFDRRQHIFAYELLFRQGQENFYSAADGDQATSQVIVNSFWLIGLSTLTGGKRAFINFTANLLKNEIVTMLPADQIAVEILETVDPTADIVEACRKIRELGFLIVLDDFVFEPRFEPLMELADIIKIDFQITGIEEQIKLIEMCRGKDIRFLAEKVETPEEFRQAMELGYTYFQGYFFSKPIIIASQSIPKNKTVNFRLLQQISSSLLDLDKLEKLIEKDVFLTYMLLKYINSASFGFRASIRSIRQALALLGVKEAVKWAALIVTRELAQDKPQELVVISVMRARFCELLANEAGYKERGSDAFLLGLLSLIDALLDRPLADILAELPVTSDVRAALLGASGLFQDIYQLSLAYEQGNWQAVVIYAGQLNIAEARLPVLHVNSLAWYKESGLE